MNKGARIGERFFIDHGTGVVIGGNAWLTHKVPPGNSVIQGREKD